MSHVMQYTEDGYPLGPGVTAFNYYDMKWGTVGYDIDRDGWFTFYHEDGTTACLNGARLATYDPRTREGWPFT